MNKGRNTAQEQNQNKILEEFYKQTTASSWLAYERAHLVRLPPVHGETPCTSCSPSSRKESSSWLPCCSAPVKLPLHLPMVKRRRRGATLPHPRATIHSLHCGWEYIEVFKNAIQLMIYITAQSEKMFRINDKQMLMILKH